MQEWYASRLTFLYRGCLSCFSTDFFLDQLATHSYGHWFLLTCCFNLSVLYSSWDYATFSCWFRISKSEIRVYLSFKWLHKNIYLSVTFSKYLLSACVENSPAGREGSCSSWGCFLIWSGFRNAVRLARIPKSFHSFLKHPGALRFLGCFGHCWNKKTAKDRVGICSSRCQLPITRYLSLPSASLPPTFIFCPISEIVFSISFKLFYFS